MRLSQFQVFMNDEFGDEYAQVLMRDLALIDFGDRTPNRAIADGEDVREVWFAICRSQDVPKSRWHGKNKSSKKQHAE
jgi:hypothetical protein